MNDLLKNTYQAIIEGDLATAQTEVRAAMDAGIAGGEVLNSALIPAMREVGSMEAVIHAIDAAGLRDRVKILIGGAPVTSELDRRIGADGFAPDASQAGVVATTLISQ